MYLYVRLWNLMEAYVRIVRATTASRSTSYKQCTAYLGVCALAIGSDSGAWGLHPEKGGKITLVARQR
jgi:hypothetical protein